MDNKIWYYSRNGRKEGPISEANLKELLLKKKITQETLVWNQAFTEWQKIGNLDDFKNIIPIEPPPLPTKASIPIKQNRPWIRYWARSFDVKLLITVFSAIYLSNYIVTNIYLVLLVCVLLSCLFWILIETICLALFGSSPGKYLLNTKVVSFNEKKPHFGQSLKRSFMVWFYGNGLYIPIVSFINQYLSFSRLKANLPLKWELSSKTRIEHKKIGSARTILFIFLFISTGVIYNNVIIKNTELRVKLKASNMWINLGYYDEAIKTCNEVISERPKSAEAYHYRGYAYYKTEIYDKALIDFNKTIKMNKKMKGVYNNRGLVYHALGKYNEALEDYTKSINEEPFFHVAYNNKGMTLLSLEKYSEALDMLNEAIELSDSTSIYYFNRAKCYTQMESLSYAVDDYSKAISIKPFYPLAFNNRGYVYLLKEEYANAKDDFTIALSMDSLNAQIWANRAIAYTILGRRKESIRDFKKAAMLGDEFSKAILRKSNVRW